MSAQAAAAMSPYEALRRLITDGLEGEALGQPVAITPILEATYTLRIAATLWTRPDMLTDAVTGRAVVGAVAADDAAARAALAKAAAKAGGDISFAKSLGAAIEENPRLILAEAQGGFVGRGVGEWRSVVEPCAECSGEGGFQCPSEKRDCVSRCEACDGAGEVDEICAVCHGEGAQASSPRVAVLEAAGAVIGEAVSRALARGCRACGGAGATKARCAECGGVGGRACARCDASGHIKCPSCHGAGERTLRHSAIARVEYALHFDLGPDAPKDVILRLKRGYEALFAADVIQPRLVSFESHGPAHRAVFEATLPVATARVEIGRRMPRVIDRVYGFGQPMVLLDPPALLDRLQARALHLEGGGGAARAKQAAAVLERSRVGRQALAAAARQAPRFDVEEASPFASPHLAQQLFEIGRTCHRLVGWRGRAWIWAAAALGAPAFAFGLAQAGFGDLVARATAAPAARTVLTMAPYALWWAAAVGLFTLLYARSVRRALGLTRGVSFGAAAFGTRGAGFALVGGAALYALAMFGPPGDAERFRAWVADVAPRALDALRLEPAGPERAAATRVAVAPAREPEIIAGPAVGFGAPRDSAALATASLPIDSRLAEPEAATQAMNEARPDRWALVDGAATVRAETPDAALQAVCGARGPAFVLRRPGRANAGRVQVTLDGRSVGVRRGYALAPAAEAMWWPATPEDRAAFETASEARFFVTDADGAMTTGYSFTLMGFGPAAKKAFLHCVE